MFIIVKVIKKNVGSKEINVRNSIKLIVLFVCLKWSDFIFLKEIKFYVIFFSMFIVKFFFIEDFYYILFYSENLRFIIDFRDCY